MKKLLAMFLAGTMVFSVAATTFAAESEVISDETATLRMYGPGLFAEVGAEGVVDLISGVERPGYNELVKRWNELYPNVTLEIEAVPWDNWKAAVQTAALSGEYDILIHGNANADFCLDLTEYIEGDEEVKNNVTFYPFRRNPNNFNEVRAYGVSYCLNPIVCVVDKQIFENYGVELPTADWTYADLAEMAEKLTGTDPVTGEQTYGLSMCKAGEAYKNYKVVGLGLNNEIFEFAEKHKDVKVNFDNPKTVEVFDMIARLGQTCSPDYLEGQDLTFSWTKQNNIAMTWLDGAFNIYNTIKANGLEDRFMFMALPLVSEGEDAGRTSSVLQDLNIAIYKETEQKDLAWAFLKFLLTDPVAQQWLVDTNSIPANMQYTTLLYDVMSEDYVGAIKQIIESNPFSFDSSASKYYDSTWFGTLQNDVVTAADEVIRGNQTSAEVVKTIQENINAYMNALE